jgi:hypothetical protein
MRESSVRGTGVIAALCAALFVLAAASPAAGASFVVNNANDAAADGCTTAPLGCTLRDAITDANANASLVDDDITFTVTGSISLASSLPTITTPTRIRGPGASSLDVRGDAMTSPILSVNSTAGTVTLENLTLSGARATAFAGGAISMGGGTLFLDSVVLSDNQAGQGGAIFYDHGLTVIMNSTLTGNSAVFGAGAIRGSKFGADPAGIGRLINSTVTGNSSKEFGGAINISNGATLTVLSSTITDNTANSDNDVSGDGGGIYNNLSTVNIANTILAANIVGSGAPSNNGQCGGNAYTSLGHNLRSVADPNCTGFNATGDVVNPSPLLGSLGMNGGPTPTIPLLAGSPAIDTGDPSALDGLPPACPGTDQRALPRGGGAGQCDIGAFEVQPTPPVTPGAGTTTPPDLQTAIKKCKKKFRKGKKRKKCIKRAKQRAQA